MDFGRVIGLVGGFLDERQVAWAVCGGLGLAAYGVARTTLDADFVVDGDIEDELLAFMESNGFETIFRSRGFSNHLHRDADLGRVDFVYVRSRTRDELFAATRGVAGPEGRPVRVPKPEHLAAMKVAAMAADRSRTFQELADIRLLLGLPGIDRDEVRRYFARHGLEDRFDELIATL